MSQLQTYEHSSEGLCEECKARPSVGPCAACHGMICGDCCTLTTDPAGKSVICLSCTRLIASVDRKPLRRRPRSSITTTLLILAVIALGVLARLLR